jgi:hypothetical protein
MSPEHTETPVDGERYVVELESLSHRVAAIEFRIRRDHVEILYGGTCYGMPDRERLRAWLSEPVGPESDLHVDDVSFMLDHPFCDGPSLVLTDTAVWPLQADVLAGLRERL